MITAAQDQALQTNWRKANIDNINYFPLYQLCHVIDEPYSHAYSQWLGATSQNVFKIRHDLITTRIHLDLYHK